MARDLSWENISESSNQRSFFSDGSSRILYMAMSITSCHQGIKLSELVCPESTNSSQLQSSILSLIISWTSEFGIGIQSFIIFSQHIIFFILIQRFILSNLIFCVSIWFSCYSCSFCIYLFYLFYFPCLLFYLD